MTDHVSLLTYLQQRMPEIPTREPVNPGLNTTSTSYRWTDIHGIGIWNDFSLTTIRNRYGRLLNAVRLPRNPMSGSPVRAITAENPLRSKISELVLPRVRRALRAGFMHLGNQNGITPLSFDVGEYARTIHQFKPDIAYFVDGLPEGSANNRAPGDIKPSWKWRSAWVDSLNHIDRSEFRQALSQVNWYMKQHRSRYGFILTDCELVVFRRLDNNGNLQLARPISFTQYGNSQNPRMTVLLALWYLGMLAAQDQGADRWDM
ncbi:hypothetical protein DTO027B5_128 [Paecilomyces variotii]|nr:hypothetical protein DTO027B3_6523 [Paecilomyces variotii]KAJ9337976.1 hypothetical protein DTO027B5_128 [Paecilomyces variotii]